MIYIEKYSSVAYEGDRAFLETSYKVLLFNKLVLFSVLNSRQLQEVEESEPTKSKIGFKKLTSDQPNNNID